MVRQKTALNKLETLLKARQLLPETVRRVVGAGSVSNRMAKLPGGAGRDSALTRLLRGMRSESRTDSRALTPRQLRIEELSGEALARANGLRGRSGPWAGLAVVPAATPEEAVKTPLYRAAVAANGVTQPRNTRLPARLYYNPAEVSQPVQVIRSRGRVRDIPRSSLRSTVVHEMAEADALRRGQQLHGALENLSDGSARTALHRRQGLVPFATHYDPGVLVKQYGSNAGMGWRRDALGSRTSFADNDVFGPRVQLDPSEKKLESIMRQVRVSPTGDFPAGGRHEAAVRRRLVRELLAHPKKYAPDLQAAFDHGAAGARLQPDLESYLLDHLEQYVRRRR